VNIEILDMNEGQSGFSVYAVIEGNKGEIQFRKGFPKGEGLLKEDEDGVPLFIKRLKKEYKRRTENSVNTEGDTEKCADDYCSSYEV